MKEIQWQKLLETINGTKCETIPPGFIIDSPWLPGWFGISTIDYFSNDELWFEANKRAVETFPDVMFLPGFWSEYGMCTEPSAFGAKCSFKKNDLPHAEKIISSVGDIDSLTLPKTETDGLAPFVLNRIRLNRKKIESLGHSIRFACARGPLNIASFLMGTTEFLITLRTDPDKAHKLLGIITEYTENWLRLQKQEFGTIDGILILDDIVGFCGEPDFQEFASRYLKRLFSSFDCSVRFFHNDADAKGCSPHLAEVGVNMFNFSFLHSIQELRQWTGGEITLFGNIPPRDVLASGTPEQVAESVRSNFSGLENTSRIIASAGGGMPDGVSTENIRSFTDALGDISSLPS
ncbi:uroporphyrinogen decarboxylase family protein [Sedimentisphaera salicampi]|uniref:uroporphyrinogen decarboxylase family protein n=1 Tax=Sedimentisphaera salicampi TaxID=1941349 RepID=UPI000B9A4DCD|nr:uroporphyrinogen decarboxylase family protein [Sedimentisphaera salicampi]OXU16064.1 Uroporphyrinogen decarboxylase [Sedimentisphaera salicampi]